MQWGAVISNRLLPVRADTAEPRRAAQAGEREASQDPTIYITDRYGLPATWGHRGWKKEKAVNIYLVDYSSFS